MEFILGRYSVLFYSTVLFVVTAAAAFKYLVALPVAIVQTECSRWAGHTGLDRRFCRV